MKRFMMLAAFALALILVVVYADPLPAVTVRALYPQNQGDMIVICYPAVADAYGRASARSADPVYGYVYSVTCEPGTKLIPDTPYDVKMFNLAPGTDVEVGQDIFGGACTDMSRVISNARGPFNVRLRGPVRLDVTNLGAGKRAVITVAITQAIDFSQVGEGEGEAVVCDMAPVGTPDALDLYEGDTATFSITTTGGYPPYKYQWAAGTTNNEIEGATTSVLTISNVVTDFTGDLFCNLKDSSYPECGVTTSNTMALTTKPVLAFTTQPASDSVCAGTQKTFYVEPTGGYTPYTYQWRTNTSNVSGATESTFTRQSDQPVECLWFQAPFTSWSWGDGWSHVDNTVSHAAGAGSFLTALHADQKHPLLSSREVALTVVVDSISGGYILLYIDNGSPFMICTPGTHYANVSIGTGNKDVKIYAGPNIVCRISSFSAIQNQDPGPGTLSVDCRVGDSPEFGDPASVEGGPATLTIWECNAGVAVAPGTGSAHLTEAYTFSVTVTGGQTPYTYQWMKNASTTVVYGATHSSYRIDVVGTGNQDNYWCRVRDVHTPTSPDLTPTGNLVVAAIPSFAVNPIADTACAGTTHDFSVTAQGGFPPYFYQWVKTAQHATIQGATQTKYTTGSLTSADATDYYCLLRDNIETPSVYSLGAALTVDPCNLAIQTPPPSYSAYIGASYVFSILATGGSAPLAYQWAKTHTNTPISNATLSTYTLTSVATADGNNYFCRVRDAYYNTLNQQVWCNTAALTVGITPTLATSPVGGTRYQGESFTFSLSAQDGFPPYTYWWARGGGATIQGATQTALTITNIQTGDLGDYYGGFWDALTTNVGATKATLSNPAPTITTQPVSGTRLDTQNYKFTCVPANGMTPYAYQWYRGTVGAGTPLPTIMTDGFPNIAGASSSCLTLVCVGSEFTADYQCKIGDQYAAGRAYSNTANLTVTP